MRLSHWLNTPGSALKLKVGVAAIGVLCLFVLMLSSVSTADKLRADNAELHVQIATMTIDRSVVKGELETCKLRTEVIRAKAEKEVFYYKGLLEGMGHGTN